MGDYVTVGQLEAEIGDESFKRLEVQCLAEVKRRPIEWLFKPLLALGKITLISGDPGLGKSLTTCGFAATVSAGGAWPDGSPAEAGQCVMMSGEDDPEDTLAPRLAAAGADAAKITLVSMVSDVTYDGRVRRVHRPFNLKTDLPELAGLLGQLGGVRLVIIDPIASFMDGVDSHVNSEVRAILTPLAALAAERRVAVLCVTHQNKGAGKAIYRAMGSLAFTAAARIAYSIVPDREDETRRLLLPVKNNIAKDTVGWSYAITEVDEQPVVNWSPEALHMKAQDYVDEEEGAAKAPARGGRPRSRRNSAVEWLRQFLADGPRRQKDVELEGAAQDYSLPTLRRAFKELGARSRRRFDGDWEWSLDVV